jgi:excinuclease UvrABC nuclease subunit
MIVFKNRGVQHILTFVGGYKGDEIAGLDEISDKHGIYVAFSCKPCEEGDCYECKQVVYIGKAEGTNNLRKRISEHVNNDQASWEQNYCEDGELIVYCYAIYDGNLHDIEAALIYKNQPLANTQNKEEYNGDEYFISVSCNGEIGILSNVCRAFKLIKGGL